MGVYHRKSAGLALDGQHGGHVLRTQDAGPDVEDIQIWLHNYLNEHAVPGRAIDSDLPFAQLGLDGMACRTVLAAFEFRYSITLDEPDASCFSSFRACTAFLLAQVMAAAQADLEPVAYVDVPMMVRTVLRRR